MLLLALVAISPSYFTQHARTCAALPKLPLPSGLLCRQPPADACACPYAFHRPSILRTLTCHSLLSYVNIHLPARPYPHSLLSTPFRAYTHTHNVPSFTHPDPRQLLQPVNKCFQAAPHSFGPRRDFPSPNVHSPCPATHPPRPPYGALIPSIPVFSGGCSKRVPTPSSHLMYRHVSTPFESV